MLNPVWAWEFDVAYVAQLLLEESLVSVGLDKALFDSLVYKYEKTPLCVQVGAILGVAFGQNLNPERK